MRGAEASWMDCGAFERMQQSGYTRVHCLKTWRPRRCQPDTFDFPALIMLRPGAPREGKILGPLQQLLEALLGHLDQGAGLTGVEKNIDLFT